MLREKDFVDLLQYMRDDAKLEEVELSITLLCQIHPSHVTTDKIKVICAKGREIQVHPLPQSQASQEIAAHAKRHLSQYDEMFGMTIVHEKEAIA